MIPELVAQYVEFTLSVKNSNTLGEPVKAQIMLQMAQALNVLVPLATGANDQQANTQMAVDKHNSGFTD
jgi:hypothetical protein